MNFLIVSDREYKKTSRGIDLITTLLSEKGYNVDHLVFFRRKIFAEKQITANIRQLYLYDSIKLYRGKLQFLFPGFILLMYFHYIIKKSGINFDNYDYVILESGHPIYFASLIKNKIIYRQSDPTHISFNSNRLFYRKLEADLIKKSLFVSSALKEKFFHPDYLDKSFHWHSGFIPIQRLKNEIKDNLIIILGGELDWYLLSKIAKKYHDYQFNVIGISRIKPLQKNIIIKGYLDYDSYQKLLLSASMVIIPFSINYTRQLRQVSYTAKIFVSMQLGIPILLKAYGAIQKTENEKKLFIYKTHKEALSLLENILEKTANGQINREVSQDTKDFLNPQTAENRLKELDELFTKWIK